MEHALNAIVELMAPAQLVWLATGVLYGYLLGLLPGLGGVAGMSILLPLLFGLDQSAGLALLIGMMGALHTADTVPAVLIGVPGSASAAATVVDGYPMARQGRAREALTAAFVASMIGGIIGAVILGGIVPLARPIILAFGSPELFMLCVLGASTVALLSTRNQLAGLMMSCFGLLLGAVGAAPSEPVYRYSFGFLSLYDGIHLAVLALGLFGLPELVRLALGGGAVADAAKLEGSRMDGLRAVFKNKVLVVGNSALGAMVGAIPGIGGSVIDWICYGVTKRMVRDGSNFGKGDVRGVLAPESANNAKEGGSLVPTLLFGIPGSGTTSVLLGGLVLLNIQPGPSLARGDGIEIVYLAVWSLALANVLATVLSIMSANVASRISTIPGPLLVSHLAILLIFAAYQSAGRWSDVGLLALFGVFGVICNTLNWPRAPVLVGFVLSIPLERYLQVSVNRFGMETLERPGVWLIGLIIVALLFGGQIMRAAGLNRSKGKTAEISEPNPALTAAQYPNLRIGMDIFLLAVFVGGFIVALDFPERSARYPLVMCATGALIAFIKTVRDLIHMRRFPLAPAARLSSTERFSSQAIMTMGLIVLLFALALPLGLLWGGLIWLPIFLRLVAGLSWRMVVLDTIIAGSALFAIEQFGLGDLPPSIIF